MAPKHILLLIQCREGNPIQEPVHAVELGNSEFRLLHSPGFVQGIAAGDVFRILDDDGGFEVIRRSGNIAVQVFSLSPVDSLVEETAIRVAKLGGVLDGRIKNGMVFTVPVKAGFFAIEGVFNALVADHNGIEWYYGNVYDPTDGVTPLNWWS